MKNNESYFRFASDEIKKNEEFILKLSNNYDRILEFAFDDLKDNK